MVHLGGYWVKLARLEASSSKRLGEHTKRINVLQRVNSEALPPPLELPSDTGLHEMLKRIKGPVDPAVSRYQRQQITLRSA